jgi:hypothetical protein
MVWIEPKPTVAVKRVCGSCNNGWMSELEESARPILSPLILARGAPVELALADQLIVSRWAFKTALMADFHSRAATRLFLPSVHAAFFRNRLPPQPNCGIWIAAYSGSPVRLGIQARGSDMQLHWHNPAASGVVHLKAQVMTITIISLVLQVFRYDGDVSLIKNLHEPRGTCLIWPPNTHPVKWPPDAVVFDDDQLNAVANREGGDMSLMEESSRFSLPDAPE